MTKTISPLPIFLSGLALLAGIVAGPSRPANETTLDAPDFSKAEPFEHLSGGEATNTRRFDREAFSQPSENLSFEARGDFFVGNGFFRRLWVSAPASTRSADGLGPLYNARACQRCHLKDGRGHPPEREDDNSVSMFLRVSVPPSAEQAELIRAHMINVAPEPTYGGQLQDIALPGIPAEGQMEISYEEELIHYEDGTSESLRRPTYAVSGLGYGPMAPDVQLSPRIAPPMIGLGLLEAIPADQIRAAADPDDLDGDGISGRAKQIWSRAHQQVMLGRFGWKAGNATVADQSSEAMAGDIGIANPLFPSAAGDCTAAQEACINAIHGTDANGHEANVEVMEKVIFYSSHLAVPARRDVDASSVLQGKQLFHSTGCATCHTPSYTTGTAETIDPALRGQLIWPYTDLLLHDMGEGLADNRPEGDANGQEWRTPPLWGIGMTERVNGHTYFLHDGRARSFAEAILWHGGEAMTAREAFRTMSRSDRDTLITFLESL